MELKPFNGTLDDPSASLKPFNGQLDTPTQATPAPAPIERPSSFLRRAVLDGAGIALLPWFLVATSVDAGDLVRVLPKYRRAGVPGHLVYPSARLLPRRVSLLIEHLLDELRVLRIEPS